MLYICYEFYEMLLYVLDEINEIKLNYLSDFN